MKRKVLYISILILLVIGIILNINKKVYQEKDNKGLAIYLMNDDGKYIKSTNIPLKESGYNFNSKYSVCDGSTSILWDNELWGLELDNINRANTKCYLYFDKVTF